MNVVPEQARLTLVSDPEFWHRRAEEARCLADRTADEKVKQTMLGVADVCDSFAIGAAMCSTYEIAISHVIGRTKGS